MSALWAYLLTANNTEGTLLAKVGSSSLVGVAGALAGLLTFYVDKVMTRVFVRLGNAPLRAAG